MSSPEVPELPRLAAPSAPLPPPPPPAGAWPSAPTAPWPTAPVDPRLVSQSRPDSLSAGLSGTLQGFLWLMSLRAAIGSGLAIAARSAFSDARNFDDIAHHNHWVERHNAMSGVIGFFLIASVTSFVLGIIWTRKAHRASSALWAGERKWSSGWSIGGWFIPFANFVIPALVIGEIERIATAARAHGATLFGWSNRSASLFGKLSWIAMVAGLVVMRGADSSVEELTPDDPAGTTYYSAIIVGFALIAVGAAFLALYVPRLRRALR